ncbi:hypothetical protein MUN74_15645 [Agromyces endophyticus]|uniref:hypothetical protein n=1 Tax=Agromyces sp. H17E-10 TaxID=2932244 RepID=UPI001FD51ED0|nr:hypothetical protein [Agromyces sp. H17E-10]UOQ88684.1 hypothetical protein MUN74_15645 [Agromyces sp. H17E-10]
MAEQVHTITTMGSDAPRECTSQPTVDQGRAHGVEHAIDRALAIQRPVVVAHLRSIRRRAPGATPDQLVRILERRYLTAVTTGGAAVGATAVIPGISTGITLALSGVETAGFLEATALFAQSVTEVHGIPLESPERARALVMTLMLGTEGTDLVKQFAGQATGSGIARSAYWGELITNSLPKAVMGTVVDQLRRTFVKQFAVRGGAGIIGKALPFGIGAAIGGVGNHVLGRRVLTQSRLAFGQAPAIVPAELEPVGDDTLLVTTGKRVAQTGATVAGTLGRAAKRPFQRLGSLRSGAGEGDGGASAGDTGVGGPEADAPGGVPSAT